MRAWLLLLLAGACHRGGRTAPEPHRVVPVTAAEAATRDVPIYLEGLGNVVAYKTVMVRAQVDGVLTEVRFREGQDVKSGDVLAQIDPRPFQIQLQQADGALARDRALLRDNQLNLGRSIDLRGKNLIAQQQVDDQRAAVGQSEGAVRIDEAQIAAAKLNLSWARITSPIDGVTGVRLVDPGNLVHATDQGGIVVITQIDPIAVLFTLPQDDLVRVADELRQRALDVTALSRDGAQKLGDGELALIDNEINQATSTIRLKAIFDNPKRVLWPNQFVKARLLLTTLKSVLTVPATALQRGPSGTFAYVIGADNTVEARPVEVAQTAGDLAVVKSGLQAGERVVTEGQNQLRPGAEVEPKPAQMASSASAAPSAATP